MNINTKLLLAAMSKCMPGVEKGAALIEGTDTFIFGNGAIHSYNDHISVSVPLDIPELTGALKSVDFFKFLSKVKTDTVDIEVEENKWKIQAGRFKAELTLLKSNILDHIQGLNLSEIEWKELPPDFLDGMKLCKMGCNNTPVRGIYAEGKHMVSTDSVRLNRYQLDTDMDKFWIDDPAAGELIKMGNMTHYMVASNWVHWKAKDGIVFSCKLKDPSQYPFTAIQNMLEKHARKGEEVENKLPKALDEAVDRVAVLSSEIKGAAAIRMTFTAPELIIYSERVSGKITEAVPWEIPFLKSPDVEVWVDSTFLAEACRKVMKFYLAENGENTVLVFFTDKYTQVASTMKAQ